MWFKNFTKLGTQWDTVAALSTAFSAMEMNVIYENSKTVTDFIL